MKKFWIFFVSVLMVAVSVFSIVGCNSEKVLANYMLPESGKLLEEDFSLPSSINGNDVTWTSSNTDAIAIEKGEGQYDAKVTLGDEVEEVALTVSCGKESKSFDVNVRALDVSYFVEKFKFDQDKATVYEDFELPTATGAVNGKTASITWAVDDNGGLTSDYLNIVSEDGKTICKVTQSTVERELKLYATFSYNGHTQKPNYRVTVSYERTHEELVDYWYYNTGVSVEMSGYVVAIATAYSDTYNNVSLYMVDDDFCTGYYLYRVVLGNKSQGELLVPGAHVTVTGTINTSYGGLIETNAGGSLVVDTDKSMPKDELYSHVYAFDNDVVAGSREAVYHTATLVSLTNWKVAKKADKKVTDYTGATILTLEKNGVKVDVAVSKYLEGAYSSKDDEAYKAICNLWDTVNVGDVVSVKGILYVYSTNYQILPLSAADVTKVTDADAIAAADVAPEHGTPISTAIDKVQEVLKNNGFSSTSKNGGVFTKSSGYTVVADRQFQAPTTVAGADNVTIKYELLHASSSVAGTKYSETDAKKYNAYGEIENGLIKVTVGDEDMAYVRVTYTYTNGDVTYTTYTYHNVYTKSMTDAQVVANVKFAYELPATETVVDDIVLASTSAQYPGAKITWAIKGEVSGIEIVTAVKDGVTTYALHVKEPDTTTDKTVTLTATFTYGEASDTKDYTIKVLKVTPVETGTFKLALEQKNLNKKLYFTGKIDGSYGATTEYYSLAADVVVAAVEGGYTIKVGEKYLELDSAHHVVLTDTSTAVWAYNYSLKVFTWTIGEGSDAKIWYLGTYGTYNTISASETYRIADPSVVGVSQFVATYEKPIADYKVTDAEKAAVELEKLSKTLTVDKADETTLDVSKTEGVTFAWTLKQAEGNALPEGVTLVEGKLNVTALPSEDKSFVLIVTATCGEATANLEVTVTVKAAVKGSLLSFDSKDNRTSQDTNSQVWAANGVTFTNSKGASKSDVADYAKPARCYAQSDIKVEFTGITKIVFACNSDSYAKALVDSIGTVDGVTVTQDGKNVTVTFAAATNEFTFTCGGQIRLDSITVNP